MRYHQISLSKHQQYTHILNNSKYITYTAFFYERRKKCERAGDANADIGHTLIHYLIYTFNVRSGQQKSIHDGNLTVLCCEGEQRFAIMLLTREKEMIDSFSTYRYRREKQIQYLSSSRNSTRERYMNES